MEYRPDYAVNVEELVASKGGRLPRPVVRLIGRLLHLDYLNKYFVQGYEGVEFCTRGLEYLGVKLDVRGLENVPDDGTLYTFVSNHPLGGIDGVALGSIVGGKFGGKVKYLVNDFLMALKGLAPICVPINKVGAQSRDLPVRLDEAFSSDCHMVVFPAGLCSRRIDGRIQDLPWGKAFINKSVKTGRSIVPVHFEAENSPRFYRVASLCKTLGIKFNLAMLLLPDEMCRQRGRTFVVKIGTPIPASRFDASRTPARWAQEVRRIVYEL